jgi:hypothetical protein
VFFVTSARTRIARDALPDSSIAAIASDTIEPENAKRRGSHKLVWPIDKRRS